MRRCAVCVKDMAYTTVSYTYIRLGTCSCCTWCSGVYQREVFFRTKVWSFSSVRRKLSFYGPWSACNNGLLFCYTNTDTTINC